MAQDSVEPLSLRAAALAHINERATRIAIALARKDLASELRTELPSARNALCDVRRVLTYAWWL